MRSLELPEALRDAIRAHGASAYPFECCGALIGSGEHGVEDVVPLENVAPSDQDRRFLLSAADYRRAESLAEEAGRELLGFYHSHPDHPAEPSAFDLAHAWPNLSYVIVSVQDGLPGDLRSWRLEADRSRFEEETLPAPTASRG
jgi:proteasome lid subunit RPN8/RPN11